MYDGDTRWDRAVGPMQFIPSTWSVVGVDADGDGTRNPQDIDDAALATAVYLCSGDDDLSTEAGQVAATLRYNHSNAYVALVLATADGYSRGHFDAMNVHLVSTSFSPDTFEVRLPPLPGSARAARRDARHDRVKALKAKARAAKAGKPAAPVAVEAPSSPTAPAEPGRPDRHPHRTRHRHPTRHPHPTRRPRPTRRPLPSRSPRRHPSPPPSPSRHRSPRRPPSRRPHRHRPPGPRPRRPARATAWWTTRPPTATSSTPAWPSSSPPSPETAVWTGRHLLKVPAGSRLSPAWR